MERYIGNKEPFAFVCYAPEDAPAAEKLAARLGARVKVCAVSSLGKRERRALEKAAAIVPVLSEASREAVTALLSDGAAQGKPLIPVFLERLELPAGLRMLLGSTQGVRRFDYDSEEAFFAALLASPVLDMLSVTPAQKRAGKRSLALAAAGALLLLAAALLLILRPFSSSRIERDSTLGKLGLTGDPTRIRTVALYGDTLEKRFEDAGVYQAYVSVVNNPEIGGLYLPGTDAVAGIGALSDLSEFAQLENLEELSLAGNAVTDVSPLFSLKKLKKLDLSMQLEYIQDPYRREIEALQLSLDGISALESLETLYFCYNTWPADGSVPAWALELDTMPHFKTLVLESGAEVLPALRRQVGYEVVTLGTEVGSYEELKAAAEDPACHCIYIRQGTELTIPAGEEWTLPRNVMLNGAFLTIRVQGTMRVRGWYECGMTMTINEGAVVVEDGGGFIGGMSNTYNTGSFTVEAGGLHLIERGMEFSQDGGSYANYGTLFIGWGGTYYFNGGSAENEGRIVVEKGSAGGMPMPDNWLENKLAAVERFTGGGTVEIKELANE